MKTLHLMTQDGQGYGSERRCCEICGEMLMYRALPEDVSWTDSRALWANPAALAPVESFGDLALCDGRSNKSQHDRPVP